MTRQCRFIQPLLMRQAADPTSFNPSDIGELLYLARKFTGLGAGEMARTLRFWTMSISDFLDEYFETDVIKANFSISGIIGTALGAADAREARESTRLMTRWSVGGGLLIGLAVAALHAPIASFFAPDDDVRALVDHSSG